jgi:hypothetical protein
MWPTATEPGRTASLKTALAAYKSALERIGSSLQPQAYELLESDLDAIRCLAADATPRLRELWRNLVTAHVLYTGALLDNFIASSMGRPKPVSEGELLLLREAHNDALSALGADQ